jgi:hypothetical protein
LRLQCAVDIHISIEFEDCHLDLNVVWRQLSRLVLPKLKLLVWFVHGVAFVFQRSHHHLPSACMLHLQAAATAVGKQQINEGTRTEGTQLHCP